MYAICRCQSTHLRLNHILISFYLPSFIPSLFVLSEKSGCVCVCVFWVGSTMSRSHGGEQRKYRYQMCSSLSFPFPSFPFRVCFLLERISNQREVEDISQHIAGENN
jgi:hypothetical protein